MAPNDDKENLISLLETIEIISNKRHQRIVWVRGEGSGAYDFDETVCFFFDDVEEILGKSRKYGLTQYQYQIIKEFRDKFDEFSSNNEENYLPKDFIDTPWWQEIVDLAAGVLKAFNYKKGDE